MTDLKEKNIRQRWKKGEKEQTLRGKAKGRRMGEGEQEAGRLKIGTHLPFSSSA